MNKAIKRSIAVILLVCASISAGYLAEDMHDKLQRKEYPFGYSEIVEKYSAEYGVPAEVVYAVIKTESDFSYSAQSGKGAAGLMQLMPDTYEWLCGKAGIPYSPEKITDPETNIRCGVYYLSFCYNEFLIWETAYAAYNAGHGQVRKWLEDPELSKNGRLTSIPFAETENYVRKVSAAREIYKRLLEGDVNK